VTLNQDYVFEWSEMSTMEHKVEKLLIWH